MLHCNSPAFLRSSTLATPAQRLLTLPSPPPPGPQLGGEPPADVEMAVQGCLRDTLFELAEAVHWGLVDSAFAQQQRLNIYNQAAVELVGCLALLWCALALLIYCRVSFVGNEGGKYP